MGSNYTPPSGTLVDFDTTGTYTPDDSSDVDFLPSSTAIVTVNSISRDTILDDKLYEGRNDSVIKWNSSVGGSYRIEIGGDGVHTGYLIDSGNTYAGLEVETVIDDAAIESATTFSGSGSYEFNIYIKNNNVWTSYKQ